MGFKDIFNSLGLGDAARPGGLEKTIGVGYSHLTAGLFGGLDQPETDFDALRSVYDDMSTKDETIMTGLGFLTGSVAGKIGGYVNEDKRIEDTVRASIESLSGTIEKYRRSILSATYAHGYGVAEFTFAARGERWLLSSLTPLAPAACRFVMGRMPDNSVRIAKVRQAASGQIKDIPAYKCVVTTYGRTTEVYGDSLLRPCYPWYTFKKYIPKYWAVGLDRHGTPIIHGKSNQIEEMQAALSNMHARAWLATTEDAEINVLSGGGGDMSDGFSRAIDMCNKLLYRSMFLPSLLESGESGGSYALGSIHWRMFNDMSLQMAKDYAESELEQLWRPLIEYNFGPQESYGELPVSDALSTDDKNKLMDMFMKMLQGGVADPDADTSWMREMLRVPPLDETRVSEWEFENPGPGSAPSN